MNAAEAERLFAELGERGYGDDPYGLALERLNQAGVASARGDRERADALLAEIDAGLNETRTKLAPDDQFELDWLRDQLGSGNLGSAAGEPPS
jgi:hypothetical protein